MLLKTLDKAGTPDPTCTFKDVNGITFSTEARKVIQILLKDPEIQVNKIVEILVQEPSKIPRTNQFV